jgi:hypothetical protein
VLLEATGDLWIRSHDMQCLVSPGGNNRGAQFVGKILDGIQRGTLAAVFALRGQSDCLFGTVHFRFVADMPRPGRIVMLGISAVFAALGLYLAVGARFYRVILSADGIEVFDGLRRRRLERAGTAGRQRLVN